MLIKWLQDVKFAFLTALSLIGTSVMDLLEAIPDTIIAKIAGIIGIFVGIAAYKAQMARARKDLAEAIKTESENSKAD